LKEIEAIDPSEHAELAKAALNNMSATHKH